jgi:serine/threonine protein kinase
MEYCDGGCLEDVIDKYTASNEGKPKNQWSYMPEDKVMYYFT